MTPKLEEAWRAWDAAADAIGLLIAAGASNRKFFAALQALFEADDKLQAARRKAMN
jgi:hypothetical protein